MAPSGEHNNKMSSDMGSIPDPKSAIISHHKSHCQRLAIPELVVVSSIQYVY